MYLLNSNYLEDFSSEFIKRLRNYSLSYYLRDKITRHSEENAIHSSIIWSRESIKQINRLNEKADYNLEDLFLLISFIDLLLESADQIHFVLYKSKYSDEFKLIFDDPPYLFSKLSNREYFKEIRALFSAHPVNAREPSRNSKIRKSRYADLPFLNNPRLAALLGRKGDFYTRIWTATVDDVDTIYFPLYISNLFFYAYRINERLVNYKIRLKDIANHKI